jgi:hypothetical protein
MNSADASPASGRTIIVGHKRPRVMSRSILAPFLTFHEEAAIIGRLLAGYTALEVGLMNCVQVVRDDFDAVFKAMFRARGETFRIEIADALGRPFITTEVSEQSSRWEWAPY